MWQRAQSLVNQLHPAADSRRSFEEKLRSDLHDLLHKLWSDATQNEFDFKGSQVVIESEYQVGTLLSWFVLSCRCGYRVALLWQVDNVRAEANRLLTKLDVESAAEIDYMNQFNGMMMCVRAIEPQCYALLWRTVLTHAPWTLQSWCVSSERHRRLCLACFQTASPGSGCLVRCVTGRASSEAGSSDSSCETAYYRPAFPNEPQRAHRKWNRELQAAVDNVIEQQDGVSQCFQLLLDSLREFSDSAETSKADPAKVNLARLFFRYLLEKIAARIQEEGLEETIVGMLDREKRPSAEYGQVISQLAGARNHPESLPYFFSDLNKQLRVPMYGRDWTEVRSGATTAHMVGIVFTGLCAQAYMNVVGARTADDIFRILSVRMLEPLIFECISYSLNMFRADKIVKEADKQTAYVVVAAVAAMVANHMSVRLIIWLHSYLRELERYRDIIAAAAERYHSDTTVNL